jgi:hypothetical protein
MLERLPFPATFAPEKQSEWHASQNSINADQSPCFFDTLGVTLKMQRNWTAEVFFQDNLEESKFVPGQPVSDVFFHLLNYRFFEGMRLKTHVDSDHRVTSNRLTAVSKHSLQNGFVCHQRSRSTAGAPI